MHMPAPQKSSNFPMTAAIITGLSGADWTSNRRHARSNAFVVRMLPFSCVDVVVAIARSIAACIRSQLTSSPFWRR